VIPKNGYDENEQRINDSVPRQRESVLSDNYLNELRQMFAQFARCIRAYVSIKKNNPGVLYRTYAYQDHKVLGDEFLKQMHHCDLSNDVHG